MERLRVAIVLPGRQDADAQFHVVAKEPMATFTTRSTITEKVPEQIFSKERRRLHQASVDGGQAAVAGAC